MATECFFEKPAQMKKKHPELYEELKEYYRQDPERAVTGDAGASPTGTIGSPDLPSTEAKEGDQRHP